jgi:phosphoglycolate phosphatase
MKQHVLFDLDGTLIDSAPSILETFAAILHAKGIEPVSSLDSRIIGPPLREVLEQLLGTDDPLLIQELSGDFINRYDSAGYKRSVPYDGIEAMLGDLKSMNCKLYVVTNKRIVPTRRIIEHLGWSCHFQDRLYSADAFEPRLTNKAHTIDRVLREHKIPKQEAIYIGDRSEDQEAAEACSLDFLPVNWGYGNWIDTPQHTNLLSKPRDCARLLSGKSL